MVAADASERMQGLATTGERLHALDAVRAGALLLGVVFHATMSFVPGQQIWMVRDAESPLLGVLFFVSHVFRMSLFFLIAGFFGRMSCERLGTRAFVRDRLKRIGVPLAGFWPISVASITAVFIWGVVTQHGVEGAKKLPPPPGSQGSILETFPLTHLWFLYVLLFLYAAALVLRRALAALDRGGRLTALLDRGVGDLVRSGLAVTALAFPTALALHFRKEWLPFFGVPTPDHGLVPNAAAAVAFGTAFGFGWLLQRQATLLRVLEQRWLPHLATALVASAACLWITGVSVVVDPAQQPQGPWRLAVAFCYPLATWTWVFGLVGAALRFLSAPRPAVRYLADASYWIYLVHLPVIMTMQVLVFRLPLPALAKFALVLAVGFPLLPLSYHLLVRYTWLGAILNGRRHRRPARAAARGGVLSGATE
jgi:peptidoglycan/LPS O-acetylase OafA/YrhL